jgi:chromatin remodeling complex protein RSC6
VDIPQEGDVNKLLKTEATLALQVASRANQRCAEEKAESL